MAQFNPNPATLGIRWDVVRGTPKVADDQPNPLATLRYKPLDDVGELGFQITSVAFGGLSIPKELFNFEIKAKQPSKVFVELSFDIHTHNALPQIDKEIVEEAIFDQGELELTVHVGIYVPRLSVRLVKA